MGDLGTLTWVVDTEPLSHLTSYSYPRLLQNLLQYPYLRFRPLAYLWSDNGIFLFMIHYMPYFLFVIGGLPIWFSTTLSVASVISLNKTQFITHSRVFSLWSSFPFRCYPTALSTATDNPGTLLFYFLIIVIFCHISFENIFIKSTTNFIS